MKVILRHGEEAGGQSERALNSILAADVVPSDGWRASSSHRALPWGERRRVLFKNPLVWHQGSRNFFLS